jgi:polyhydroxybutyrate depolymerase
MEPAMTRSLPGLCLAAATATALVAGPARADCNGSPGPCDLPGGTYHIVLPQGATAPVPAVLLLHGYGGEGLGTIRNTGMVDLILRRGYAVIAPDGQPRQNGNGRTWDFHPDRPATRDETAFLTDVADDAAARFGLDRDRMLLAGFSIGGSMTSYLACQAPDGFAAYAPVAGSFWRPHPAGCAGPVRLLHTHGKADETVPLTGREIMPGFVQGNVFEAMEIWRTTNGCADDSRTDSPGIYTVEHWDGCTPGADLDFALHDGGHSIPKGWAQLALDWFEGR